MSDLCGCAASVVKVIAINELGAYDYEAAAIYTSMPVHSIKRARDAGRLGCRWPNRSDRALFLREDLDEWIATWPTYKDEE